MNVTSTSATFSQLQISNSPLLGKVDGHNPRHTDGHAVGRRVPKLLCQRYGVRENPFGVTPNPRYLYKSKSHAEARASLLIGIDCGVGFQALIAPPGMGKSTILLSILEQFSGVARTAFLSQIQGDSYDLLRGLMTELGDETCNSDLVSMQDSMNQLLVHERRAGRQTIIVIDEAQSLNISVLETIRLLSNFETHTEKLLQIILAGQPQLAQKLASPDVTQLSQRISIMTTLVPFEVADTAKYVDHRLKIAGYQGTPLFTPAALNVVWEHSGGIPREINRLCFNAMLLAMAVREKQIDADLLDEVASDFNLELVRCRLEAFAERKRAQGQDDARAEKEQPEGRQAETSCFPAVDAVNPTPPKAEEIEVKSATEGASQTSEMVTPTPHEIVARETEEDIRSTAQSQGTSASNDKGGTSAEFATSESSADLEVHSESCVQLGSERVPKSNQKVEPLTIEPAWVAAGQLPTIPMPDSLFGDAAGLRWMLTQEQQPWLTTQWRDHKHTIYLGAAALILFVVLLWPGP